MSFGTKCPGTKCPGTKLRGPLLRLLPAQQLSKTDCKYELSRWYGTIGRDANLITTNKLGRSLDQKKMMKRGIIENLII